MTAIIEVHIYRRDGEWCYVCYDEYGYDHSDTVGCMDAADAREATATIREELRIDTTVPVTRIWV